MRCSFPSLAVSLCLSLGSVAHAQTSPPTPAATDAERANELFRSAKVAFGAGNLHEAHRLYSAAWDLKKSPDIAANLGQTELELGKMRDAAEHFSYALSNLLPSSTDQQRAAVERGLAIARAEVCALRIAITPAGAEVLIDGKSAGTSPLAEPVFVESGEHSVLAKREGFVTGEVRIAAQKGGEQTVELSLAEAATVGATATEPQHSAAVQPSPTTDFGRSKNLLPAYIAGGVAVAALGAGVGFLLVANENSGEADELRERLGGGNSCGSGTPFVADCSELEDLVASKDTATTVSIAGFALAAVAGGAATYLFLSSSSSRETAATPRLSPVLSLTPQFRSLGLRGRF